MRANKETKMEEKIKRLREKASQLQSMVNRVNHLSIALAWPSRYNEGNERLSDALESIDETIDVVGLLFPEE